MIGNSDNFRDLLLEIKDFLRSEERVSYRGLKRQFSLSDDDLEDIKDELIYAQQCATDEDGRVLVWQKNNLKQGKTYTPKHLAEKILSVKSAIEGEIKQVTVLFCDVANSMTLADKLGPERWHNTLNEFFTILNGEVHAVDGTINQYTGDGIMALFGAPLAVENHAINACTAALKIRNSVLKLSNSLQAEHGLPFNIRIGLNSGEVVVGSIGDDFRMDYTAKGHVVGIAARLENMASSNQILLSESTAQQITGLANTCSLGLKDIKGVSRPLEIFELNSVAASATRFDAAKQKGLSPFVGRENEYTQLENALSQAQRGNGQIVGIAAEAGTGKSRLCHEFLSASREKGLHILEGHSAPHGKNIPYLPLLQVFRGYFGIESGDEDASARSKIQAQLSARGLATDEVLPVIFELMGVADPEAPATRVDPDAKQRQLFGLLKQIVHGAGPDATNTITCIEDLHWLDPASELFLNQWADAIAGSNSFLLVTFRPEYQAEWMRRSYYQQISLSPLGQEAVYEMLASMLGNTPQTEALTQLIYQRTGGNPFFCEEVVQTLRESGNLTLAPQRYQITNPLDELEIPASVQSVLASRIDRLSDNNKAILQNAAVIGREFTFELLAFISAIDPGQLDRTLDSLRQSEFIVESTRNGQPLYSFKHALTQEVAYHSQLHTKRVQTHAKVAEGVETLFASKPGETAALAAYHWERADEPLRAAQAYCLAATYVGVSNRHQQMEYLNRALALSQDLPQTEIRHQVRLQALAELITGGAWRFDMSDEELEKLAEEAHELAIAAGQNDLATLIRGAHYAALGMMRGEVKRWSFAIDDITADMTGISEEIQASLIGNRAFSLYTRGRFDEGISEAQRAVEMTSGDPFFGIFTGFSVLATCLNISCLNASACGRLKDAMDANKQGTSVAEQNKLNEEFIWNLSNYNEVVFSIGGDPNDPLITNGLEKAAKACELSEKIGSDFTRGVALRGRAISLYMAASYEDAEETIIQCLTLCRDRRAHLDAEARCLALLSDIQLAQGKIDDAIASAEEAISRADDEMTVYYKAMAYLSLARALLARGDRKQTDETKAALDSAAQLVEKTGGASLYPQVLEQKAILAERLNDPSGAGDYLAQALEKYETIGATGHARRLKAQHPVVSA